MNFNKFLRISVIFFVIIGWIFSGWPQIWQNPPIPPEVQEAKAAQVTLQVDATSTPDNWTLVAGANKVVAVNTPDDDATSYISSTGISGTIQQYSVANHSIPSGSTVNFVRLSSRCMRGSTPAGSFIMTVVLSGELGGTTKTSGASYANFTDDFATKPGGGAWTLDNINALEINIRNAAARTIFCTTFEVIVDYTLSLNITAPTDVQMPNYQLGGVGYSERNFQDVSALVQVTASTGFTVTVSSTNLTGGGNTILASDVKLRTDGIVGSNPTVITNCTGFTPTEPAADEYALDTDKNVVTATWSTGTTCDIYPTIKVYISNGSYVAQVTGTLTFTVF